MDKTEVENAKAQTLTNGRAQCLTTERALTRSPPKEGNLADTKVKRSTPLAQPKRRRLDRRLKNRLYESVYDLNRGFNLVLETFERLERQAFFRRDYIRAFRNIADELRAKTNYELTATLRDREQREAAEFGRLCRKWERRFKSSEDARILGKRQRRQQSSKKP